MGLLRDRHLGETDSAAVFSSGQSLGHVYFFVHAQPLESHSSSIVDKRPEGAKVDLESKSTSAVQPSLAHVYFFIDQQNQNILLQPCSNDNDAGAAATNHYKKQLSSNWRQETGGPGLSVPHKVGDRPVDPVVCPIIQQSPDEVEALRKTPSLNSGATPDLGSPDTHAPDAVWHNRLESRDHGTVDAQHLTHYQLGSHVNSMSIDPEETIASAKDIGTPTVVEIPTDAKSVAILKTIKADKIKRAGPSTVATPKGTTADFQALCADWGLDTKLPFTFQDAVNGLFGQALFEPLINSSSILRHISNFSVLSERSTLFALSNGPFTWVSSALLEFEIPKHSSIPHKGKTATILSANINLDCSKEGAITALLTANMPNDENILWSWSESNIGLDARFMHEQNRLPVTLSRIGKKVNAEFRTLSGITVLDLIQTLRLPLGALINLPLVGKMLKSVLTSATFEYNNILDRSSPPSILAGQVVFEQEKLRLGSFDLSHPEVSIIYSSSRSLVTVDEGQWTFRISAVQDALQLSTQVNYEAVDYLARFHVQPKTTLTLVDFLKLLAPNQVKAASQTALKDFKVDQADVVLDTSDWSAISCSGDMCFPNGLPSLFEYDAYSSDEIALTSTIDVPTHGYQIDVLAIQSMFDSKPEVLTNEKETTFVIEDDEIMVAAPLNNHKLWSTLALAVVENSYTSGTTIDFEADELPEMVALGPDSSASQPEVEDEGVGFHKVHRASIIQMATAVVPGSPLPSPTLVTIASGIDGGPVATSARRASRIVPSMSATPLVVPVSAKKKKQSTEDEGQSSECLKPSESPLSEEPVAKLQSDLFATNWLARHIPSEKNAEKLSIITESKSDMTAFEAPRAFKEGEILQTQTNSRPEKSISGSNIPTPATSVASNSPKYEQRELDQKSSASSLGSEFLITSKDTFRPILHDSAKESERGAGLDTEVVASQDGTLRDAPKPVLSTDDADDFTNNANLKSIQEESSESHAAAPQTFFADIELLDADPSPVLDFNYAFAPTKQSGQIEESVSIHEEQEERLDERVEKAEPASVPADIEPPVVPEEALSPIVASDNVEQVAPAPISIGTLDVPTENLEMIDNVEPKDELRELAREGDEAEVEAEEERKLPTAKEPAERRVEQEAKNISEVKANDEISPPPTPVEQVSSPVPSGHCTASQFTEQIPSTPTEAVRTPTMSPLASPPKRSETEPALNLASVNDLPSTTSDSPTTKRSRRKSIMPSKSMRNLLKRAVSFGNLRESPLPASRNISTSTSDTAIPLPPLIMNGSFASGTTEGWQVDAGRNAIKVLKENLKSYKHKLVITVRRSSLSGVCLRQRLPTESGVKYHFKLTLLYDIPGDGFLNVMVDGRQIAKHASSAGHGQVFDVEGAFVSEKKGSLLELECKSPFGKTMVFEIGSVAVEPVGNKGRLH